ncbi:PECTINESTERASE [Salix viminalis]|uniref:Pectinesterase n=1 Tax=Salix viminalis TaxID=40686 RepID=A0A9Q0T7R9_SALVM|nr:PECTINESTERASE [Salix viminalis]
MHYKIPALSLLHLHPGHPSRAKNQDIYWARKLKRKCFGKVVVSAISLILVVGAVIGVVALVQPSQKGSGGENEPGNISPSMRIANQLCQPSDYKEACTKTLSSVNSTDPKEFVKQAILAASDAVKKSFNFSDDLVVKASQNKREKMALDDCKELLDYAVQELQASLSMVGDSDLHTTNNRVAELQSWLSAVLAYQETCVDGFDDKSPIKPIVQQGFVDASQLTDNVLAIISGLSDFLKSMGLQFNIPSSNSRRLLGEDGFPTWFSGADRKLLAAQGNGNVKPNAVVAQDGSGQFKTISAAIAAYPSNLKGRYIIYVKAGTYREYVTVDKNKPNVFIYGDGPRKTIVTGSKSFAKDGLGTWKTATFVAEADGFIAKSIGFQNTAGPDGHQAVALRVSSDMSVFLNCRMDGYQDTLLYQAKRQFYRNCVISGTVDFIFGYGAAVIQNSLIVVRRPNANQQNTVTADGRKENHATTGLVIHNCRIVPEQKLVADRFKIPTYLGRPWKQFSRTVIMESELADFIQPAGWMPWAGSLYLDTLYYAEYGNRGAGANTNKRVSWKTFRVINRNEALQFTAGQFLQGAAWIRNAGAPVLLGLKR